MEESKVLVNSHIRKVLESCATIESLINKEDLSSLADLLTHAQGTANHVQHIKILVKQDEDDRKALEA